ncbi:MAG TPA: stress response translation initiation inhibitor YciH [Thermoprotei archaeon]|nr:stress response translation initiation inhibitor YciH [Thermoprotei archaeon]
MDEGSKIIGASDEIGIWEDLLKEQQKIEVRVEKSKYKKEITVVSGFTDPAEAKRIASLLKTKLACGGTYKNDEIALQGNHANRVKEILVAEGYQESNIVVTP